MAAINAPCPTGDCRNHRVSQQPSVATESFSVNYGKCLPKLQKSTKKKTATRTSPTSAPSSDLHDQNGTKSEERVDHDGTRWNKGALKKICTNSHSCCLWGLSQSIWVRGHRPGSGQPRGKLLRDPIQGYDPRTKSSTF